MLVVRILPWTRLFCNIHFIRVPRSWTGSVQMKSSMTFIRVKGAQRERKIILKAAKKRLKECALPLKCFRTMRISTQISFFFY